MTSKSALEYEDLLNATKELTSECIRLIKGEQKLTKIISELTNRVEKLEKEK